MGKVFMVIGGGGFLGRRIIEMLIEQGQTVKAFDLNKTWDHEKLEFITGDLTNPESVKAALKVKL
jgi:sterol-4alpha-carboxylate 3-dehydrogenase (decarboxylating)